MDDHLPAPLRDSKLPWEPDHEDQSGAPAPQDSWRAVVGSLEWSLIVCGGSSTTFLLSLRALPQDEPHATWDLPHVRDAAVVADAVHELLLSQVVKAIQSP